ncbi:flavin reductase family protein [Dysgonomonas sp. 216]|uniref:flavin reductase n=1 Tax=Dysgonomonas sp. 216 TaxID=2302934 RepID=UPI0013D1DFE0|nr:flavin reductase [Dysgonomonas sp. 216]NDW18805.1 flavin reductase family protein [Dysgonomonas sp. 216]
MKNFREEDVKDLQLNAFDLKNKWMLITAGKDGAVNTMTASWGGFGVMWGKDVVFVVIRPQRYTKEFIDGTDSFSLTFFDESFKKQLSYLGRVSGRDEAKIEKAGLTVSLNDEKTPYFKDAETVIFAKKLFAQPLNESSFLDTDIIDRWYPEKDFHTLYIAEVTKILTKD